jgi:hypothetical protein
MQGLTVDKSFGARSGVSGKRWRREAVQVALQGVHFFTFASLAKTIEFVDERRRSAVRA